MLPRVLSWLRASPWRALFLILALFNLKNLPLVWHLRFVRSLFGQLYGRRARRLTPGDLFKPMITVPFRTPLLETDYNLHKSNSTYFSDLDMARTQLVTA